jgi:uncharacterized protein with HEPN domain
VTRDPDTEPLPERVVADLLDLDTGFRAAAELVRRGKAAYDADEMLRFAAEAISNRLGEAVQRLDAGWRSTVPEVPWRLIRDNRNFAVHAYEGINYDRLWNTLATEVPKVASLLAPFIEQAARVRP